jgi:hypothetical protein
MSRVPPVTESLSDSGICLGRGFANAPAFVPRAMEARQDRRYKKATQLPSAKADAPRTGRLRQRTGGSLPFVCVKTTTRQRTKRILDFESMHDRGLRDVATLEAHARESKITKKFTEREEIGISCS